MKFVWTVVLFASIVLAVAVPIFFGHGLAAHESKFFGYAAVCLVLAAVLFFVQRGVNADNNPAHH
jgi:hypothetical protein